MSQNDEELNEDDGAFEIFNDPDRSFTAIRRATEIILKESGQPQRAAIMMFGPLLLIAGGVLIENAEAADRVEALPLDDLYALCGCSIDDYASAIIHNRIGDPNMTEEVITGFRQFVAISSLMLAKSIEGEVAFRDHPLLSALFKEFLTTMASSGASKN